MVKKILIGLGSVLFALVIYAALQPADYKIAREITISAPSEKIFPWVNHSQKMDSWNPWFEMDKTAKITYSGPDEGTGSKSTWSGGEELGEGNATVIKSIPNSLVVTELEFLEPMHMKQIAQFELIPHEGNLTRVIWSVQGTNSFLMRLICLITFTNMEKMVGHQFDKGLLKLKNLCEQP